MILVENPGSITFEFQDLSKIVTLAKKKKILTSSLAMIVIQLF